MMPAPAVVPTFRQQRKSVPSALSQRALTAGCLEYGLDLGNQRRLNGIARRCPHSPILLACPGAEIYNFDTIPVTPIDYKETEHYRIYKELLKERAEH